MNLEKATQVMKLDSPVSYEKGKYYILYVDSLSGTCALSNHSADYVGKMSVLKHIPIKNLEKLEVNN